MTTPNVDEGVEQLEFSLSIVEVINRFKNFGESLVYFL